MNRGENRTKADDELARLERLVRRTDRGIKEARARAARVCRRLADRNGSAERDKEDGWPADS